MKVATSRYQARELILASGLAPVRITLGRPKFKLGYELAGRVNDLAPRGYMLKLEDDEFREAFSAHLRQLDAERILQQLGSIAEGVGASGVVMLCFEDVLAGQTCHRRLVAEWIRESVGLLVPELGDSEAAMAT